MSNKNKPAKRQIVQSTQTQLPIKDITNDVIITQDNRMVKLVEIKPIAFQTMKAQQQNYIRQMFENLLKIAPNEFQIKSVSVPSNLSGQISQVNFNISQEKNDECKKLGEEYKNKLIETQENTVERKFYIAFSNPELDSKLRGKEQDITKAIYRLNQIGASIAGRIGECGNDGYSLNNSEIAETLYMLLNRNTSQQLPFAKRYEQVFRKYVHELQTDDVYISPNEYLAPKKIQFTDKKFVVCDDRYYSFLYMPSTGYPDIVYTGWLDIFVNSMEGVDVDIYVRKKDKNRYSTSLKRTMGHTSSDMGDYYNGTSDSYYNSSNKYSAASLMLHKIRSGYEIYDVSIMITISSNSIADTQRKMELLIEEAKSRDIKLTELVYQEEQAFISSLPLNKLDSSIEKKAKRNMPQDTVSTLYPFTAFQLVHDRGLYIADSLLSNSPIIPDFWNTQFVSNPHIFMCGMAGAGKTSAMELLSIHARVMNIPVFIIAPEKQDDYKRLCLALGGQYISIGQGSPNRINIMEIFENDANVDRSKDELYQELNQKESHLQQRIGVVIEFINTYYYSLTQQSMTPTENSLLNDALIVVYASKGITTDNESLWNEEHTAYKEMPILSDLVPVLEQMGQPAESLYRSLKYLTTGVGSFFNGQTNVDVKNKFFVIGMENNTKETKALAAYVAEDFCQLKIREDRIKRSLYVIDEGWSMLDNPAIAEKIKEDSKILRGYQCMLLFGTQQLADVLSTIQGQAIIKNSDTRIIMQHKDEDVKYVSQYIDLTPSEQKKIRGFSVGEALLLANDVRIPIKFNPSDFEALLTFNDEKTLARYAEYVKQKKAKEQDKKEIEDKAENGLSINDLSQTSSSSVQAITSEDYMNYLHDKEGVNL